MWVQDRVEDGRRAVEHGLKDGRRAVEDGLKDSRRFLDDRFGDSRKVFHVGVGAASPLWPTFLAAAGAGVAFWWWTQWSRGRAEAEARAAVGQPEGGGEVPIDHPEMVMAHNPAPKGAPDDDARNPSAAKLTVPAEEVMAHAPVDPEPPTKKKVSKPLKPDDAAAKAPVTKGAARSSRSGAEGGKTPLTPGSRAPRRTASGAKADALSHAASAALASAPAALDESLGVQGAATPPKRTRRASGNGAAGGPPPARKPRPPRGPTVM